jgi:uncharacterized protein (TIGR03118 family)
MRYVSRLWKFPVAFAVGILLLPVAIQAQHYTQTNLVSNIAGQAPVTDPNLQNPWGLVASPAGSPWWVSDNNNGVSTLYSISGTGASLAASIVEINGNGIVTVPNAPSQPAPGSPTGIMFNGSKTDFIIPGTTSPAAFIFVTEDGTVQAWAGGASSTIVADHSQIPNAANGAVYKGATILAVDGQEYILAANFRSGRIDVYNSSFQQVWLPFGAFEDFDLPFGYAPFNVQGVGPNVYVTYAKQDAQRHDPVQPGLPGDGFVTVFDRHGRLIQRLEHGPWFNAPWGVVWATPPFGAFGNTILIGNFRGDNIAAFNPVTGHFLGNMLNADGSTILIDGLWALRFGSEGKSGPATTLFFTAGPDNEMNGLFGTLTAVQGELDLGTQQ